jgi:acetyl esterase/lipase
MKIVTISLAQDASLTGYLWDDSPDYPASRKNRPAVIVCPGGAYLFCSDREAEPVSFVFLNAGYQVFTLRYSTGAGAAGWQPMIQLSRSILYLREHAEALRVMPDQIAVCGFSAGGHLACCGGLLWNAPAVQAASPAPHAENRPNAVILGYPVISSGPFTHEETMKNIAGDDPALRETFSLEKRVTPDAPPMFLWHTVADEAVPVENSLLLAAALQKNKVPFELHLFAEGAHGSSLCTDGVGTPNAHNAQWTKLCLEWLNRIFDYSL